MQTCFPIHLYIYLLIYMHIDLCRSIAYLYLAMHNFFPIYLKIYLLIYIHLYRSACNLQA